MKNHGFIKLYRSVLSKPEVADLVAEQGAVGFGVYLIVLLYLAQCDDFEGSFTNAQLQALAAKTRKSRAYVRHIICDYGLFTIEGKRFHDSFRNQYSPARTNRNAGEEIEIDKEKENKEKAGGRVSADTPPASAALHPSPPAEPTVRETIGPSAYETIDRQGLRHGRLGETVGWWAPPQRDLRSRWSAVEDRWVPPDAYDPEAEQQRRREMRAEDFMMKTAWEQLDENELKRIEDHARRT